MLDVNKCALGFLELENQEKKSYFEGLYGTIAWEVFDLHKEFGE